MTPIALRRTLAMVRLTVAALCALAAPALADMSAIRINEIGWATRAGDVNTQFVELVATAPGQTRDAELHLEMTSALGSVSDNAITFGAAEGSNWAQGTTWLLGGSAFNTKVGLARDGAVSKLDVAGGTITLWTYDTNGDRVDLDTFAWSRGPGMARAPFNGQSLQRAAGGFTTQAHPAPANSKGASAVDVGYGYDPQTQWVIDEVFFDCANSTTNARYVQLRATADGYFDPNLLLRAVDAGGRTLSQTKLFAATAGQTLARDSYWLSATASFQSAIGLTPDLLLVNPPSATSGAIEVLMPNAVGDSLAVIARLTYGSATGAVAVPTKGLALHHASDGAYFVSAPKPTNRFGTTVQSSSCFGQASAGLAWHVREFGMGCVDRVPGLWFVTLSPDFAQTVDPRLGFRMLDHAGATLIEIPALGADGSSPAWLLASAVFATTTGLTPDRIVDATPDPLGGRIQLISTSEGVTGVVQELAYGSTTQTVIAPPLGGGSIRLVGNTYTFQASATPTRSDGTVSKSDCFNPLNAETVRIDQIGLRCASGSLNTEFVELHSFNGSSRLDSRLGLRIFDHTGASLGDLRPSFGLRPTTLGTNQNYLLGGSRLASDVIVPDLVLPTALDHAGGRLQLYRVRVDSSLQVLSDVSYGPPGISAPDGTGLLRLDDTTYVLSIAPSPRTFTGQTLTSSVCYGALADSSAYIQEFGTNCHDATPGFWFVNLRPKLNDAVTNSGLMLRAYDHNGTLLFQRDHLGIPATTTDFLIGPAQFMAATGVSPDLVLPDAVDPAAGRLELFAVIQGTDVVLSRLIYGNGTANPVPPPGGSLRASGKLFTVQSVATPTRSDGTLVQGRCFLSAPSTALRISEIGLRCAVGTPSRAFMELQSVGADAALDWRLTLKWLDSNGQTTGDLSGALFAHAGLYLPKGSSLLIAPTSFAQVGPAPDITLSFQPDTIGGRLLLLRARSDGKLDTLSDVAYGPQSVSIPAGKSLALTFDGRYAVGYASPTNLAGQSAKGSPCFVALPTTPWVAEELGTRCLSGEPASFIQLKAVTLTNPTTDFGMLVQDSTGRTIADFPGFLRHYAGTQIASGTRLLFAGPAFASLSTVPPDFTLPVELDPRGGAVVIYVDPLGNSAKRVWTNTLPYGYGNYVAPPPGRALVQNDNGDRSIVSRPIPLDVLGAAHLTRCYVPADTAVRIAELGLGCYNGGTKYRYVTLQTFDPTISVTRGLGVRMWDGAGRLIEDRPITSPSVVGKSWGLAYETYNTRSYRMLLADASFENATGLIADERLTTGPDPDSGTVELYFHDDYDGRVTVLDRWEYGSVGRAAPPRPGESLIRDGSGAIVPLALQTPGGFQNQHRFSTCLRPDYFSTSIEQLSLQCVDGSLAGQYIELRASAAQVCDPDLGVEARNAAGNVIFDVRDLFGARRWQAFPAGAALLLAPAEAATRVGVAPDYTIPVALDTSGGQVTLYHLNSDGTRRSVSSLSYGGASPLPPPGCVILAPYGTASQSRPQPQRFPTLPWPLTGCGEELPRVRISELANGCSYEPFDGGGFFVELRAETTLAVKGVYTLDLAGNAARIGLPVLASAAGRTLARGQNWLLASSSFALTNGLTPDETPVAPVPASTSQTVTLFWSPGARYSGLAIDALSASGLGNSVERTPDGQALVRAIPEPRNSTGETMATNACLNGADDTPAELYSFAPGCHAGGASAAFVMLYNFARAGSGAMRLKITGHDGSVLCDLADLFGPGIAATSEPNGPAGIWLIGATGFAAAAQYAANIELPIRFDPQGGEIRLYRAQSNGTDRITSRVTYPALELGSGQQRGDTSFPGVFRVRSVLPVAHGDFSGDPWSSYGEYRGQNMRFRSAGLACPGGSRTSSFVEIAYPLEVNSECRYLPSTCRSSPVPPHGGWIRSLDSHGVVMDSVSLFAPSPLTNAGFLVSTPRTALFASNSIAAVAERIPVDHPPRMDPLGGTLQFVMMTPAGTPAEVADSRPYGSVAGQPAALGTFFRDAHYPPVVDACSPCGVHALFLSSGLAPVHSTQPMFDFQDTPVASGGSGVHFAVDGTNARTTFDNPAGKTLSAFTSTEFRWRGGAPNVPATFRARLSVHSSLELKYATLQPANVAMTVTLDGDQPDWQDRIWAIVGPASPVVIDDTMDVIVHAVPDEPFRLGFRLLDYTDNLARIGFTAQWSFDQLPPGAFVTSCHGFGGAPVPNALALTKAQPFHDHVELAWTGGNANTRFSLERHAVSGTTFAGWLPLATLLANGEGQVIYTDPDVVAGASYDYRLRGSDGSTSAETRVSVPVRARLALAIAGGQPVHGPLEFAVTRPGSAAARLELFDIAGRLVDAHVFTAGGDVTQHVTLNTGTAKAGVFLARLTCGAENRFARVVRVP